MSTQRANDFVVRFPFTSTLADYVTASNASTWVPSPTELTTISTFIGEVSLGQNITKAYSIDPKWWAYNTATKSWNVGLPGDQTTKPTQEQSFTNYRKDVALTRSDSRSLTTGIPPPTSSKNAETGSQDISAQASTASVTSSSAVSSATNGTLHSSARRGLSSGAVAGIGVGSAAAGAILALLLAFFIMRRKSSSSKAYVGAAQIRSTPSGESSPGLEKTPAMLAPLSRKGDNSGLPLLPPPTETSELVGMFSRLSTAVQNHAYSYFSERPEDNNSGTQSSNSGDVNMILGPGAPVSSKTMLDLLSGPQRVAAVRLLLGWAILSNIDAHSDTTVLPVEVVKCLRTFSEDPSIDLTLLSKWRHLTGTLFASTYGSKPTDIRIQNRDGLTKLVSLLDDILAPLGNSGEKTNRRDNLEQIVKLGAQSGYILLTQPTGWEFEWQSATAKAGKALVVFPDLVQVEDDMGRTLDPPRLCNIMKVVHVG